MEGRDNGRIWNWPSSAEIKSTTINLLLNGSLGRNLHFVLVPVAEGSFQATSHSQDWDQLDLRNPGST